MRKVTFIVCGIFLLGGLVVALVLWSHRSQHTDALSTYRSEMVARGEKLTFEELLRDHPASENSTVDALDAGVAPLARRPAIDPGGMALMHYVAPGQVTVLKDSAELVLDTSRGLEHTWIGLLQKPDFVSNLVFNFVEIGNFQTKFETKFRTKFGKRKTAFRDKL